MSVEEGEGAVLGCKSSEQTFSRVPEEAKTADVWLFNFILIWYGLGCGFKPSPGTLSLRISNAEQGCSQKSFLRQTQRRASSLNNRRPFHCQSPMAPLSPSLWRRPPLCSFKTLDSKLRQGTKTFQACNPTPMSETFATPLDLHESAALAPKPPPSPPGHRRSYYPQVGLGECLQCIS